MRPVILLILVGGVITVAILIAMALPKWADAQAVEAQARAAEAQALAVEAQARAMIADAQARSDIVFTLAVCALLALALLVVGLPLAVLLGALLAVKAVQELAQPVVYRLEAGDQRRQLLDTPGQLDAPVWREEYYERTR